MKDGYGAIENLSTWSISNVTNINYLFRFVNATRMFFYSH